jgi:hypothetical protein
LCWGALFAAIAEFWSLLSDRCLSSWSDVSRSVHKNKVQWGCGAVKEMNRLRLMIKVEYTTMKTYLLSSFKQNIFDATYRPDQRPDRRWPWEHCLAIGHNDPRTSNPVSRLTDRVYSRRRQRISAWPARSRKESQPQVERESSAVAQWGLPLQYQAEPNHDSTYNACGDERKWLVR